MKTKKVKMSELIELLENEEEINEEYNALEKAIAELDDIYYSDNEDDEKVKVTSRELTLRGYKAISRNKIKETGIDTLLEEYRKELRKKIMIIDLYHKVQYSSREVVSDEVIEDAQCAKAITVDEFKKGDFKLMVSYEYELILNEKNKNLFFSLSEEEKINFIIENGNYLI